ncbi:MAG: YhgN family NAAT transporter [Pantoea sp. Brub]|nr:YhgN family NAAT transporter [Pantoea sp. Brub]
MNEMVSGIILLFLIMDPLGNLPIFMSILKYVEPKRRRMILIREMFIALIIMFVFLIFGEYILIFLNLRTESVSISGGIILFFIAIKMIFPSSDENNMGLSSEKEPFLVPLAIPLIAGPSLLATLMMLSHQYAKQTIYLIGIIIISWGLSLIILLLSNLFFKILGEKGVNVLEKLMGLILVIIAVQMFLDGIKVYMKL